MRAAENRPGGGGRRRGGTLRLVGPLAYMALIWWLSSQPLPVDLPGGSDKLVHALAFAVLCALWLAALAPRAWSAARTALFAVAATALWGALDEVHQSFVPGRSPDVLDALADLSGALVAALGYLAMRRAGASSVHRRSVVK
jgi:hypothetical protein